MIRRTALALGVLLGAQAHGQALPPAPYVDRVIDPSSLPALSEDDGEAIDPTGSPRGVRIEVGTGVTDANGRLNHESGVTVDGYLETQNYGTWSVQADVSKNDRSEGLLERWTVFQRGLILGSGWRLDNGLGSLGSPLPPLVRQQYRFVLPSSTLQGASTDATAPDGRRFQAAAGRAGVLSGGRYSGFDRFSGPLWSLGAQTRDGPVRAGVAVVSSRVDDRSSTTGLVTAAWTGDRRSVQANVLQDAGHGTGVWIDASAQPNRLEHHVGAFRFDPGLTWGGQDLQADVQGAYYRVASRKARSSWSMGVDTFGAVEGDRPVSTYLTGQYRYQATGRWGWGGATSVIAAGGDTASTVQAFVDRRNAWGTGRAQFDHGQSKDLRSDQISLDQSFAGGGSGSVATNVAYLVQSDAQGRRGQSWSGSVYGGHSLGPRLRWDGSFRWTGGSGPLAQTGIDANLGVDWTLSPAWALTANVYQSQGRRAAPFDLDPLALPVVDPLEKNRSVFIALRYDHRAGRSIGVLGGSASAGAGNVLGQLYLDANADGRRDANEAVAQDVVVVLDGRYSTRTDAQGRFRFDRVAAGSHTLTVVPDNVPLPWSLPSDPLPIVVRVRETTEITLGAKRPTE